MFRAIGDIRLGSQHPYWLIFYWSFIALPRLMRGCRFSPRSSKFWNPIFRSITENSISLKKIFFNYYLYTNVSLNFQSTYIKLWYYIKNFNMKLSKKVVKTVRDLILGRRTRLYSYKRRKKKKQLSKKTKICNYNKIRSKLELDRTGQV